MTPPLVAHIIYRLGVGGMENGLVNLINAMPRERYRHVIICLESYSDFKQRLRRDDVEVIALNKRAGNDLGLYWRLYKTLRRLRPAIVHTRNLAALEMQGIACLARIGARVHGEHGRDMVDLHGLNRKYNALRKLMRLCVHRYIAVSRDLAGWLERTVEVKPTRISQIYNGVNSERFHPRRDARASIGRPNFLAEDAFVVGSVGRMAEVKDYPTLVEAFLAARETDAELARRLRLVIVGDGPARMQCLHMLETAGASDAAWLPGERNDIPDIVRALDLFVLPSLGEGIANTILEAMASGLPVVATRVGGNPELVDESATGFLVPCSDVPAMRDAIVRYARDTTLARAHGHAARQKIESFFSMDAMVHGYLGVYDALLHKRSRSRASIATEATT